MIGKRIFLLILVLLVGLRPEVNAQKQKEDDQLKKADKLFEAGKYADAYPLYTHLLSMHKGNVDITFKYGATLLYGSDNKADAIPYLKKAADKPTTDIRVHYFLGKAYQLNYEFKKAIGAYRVFKEKADPKMLEDFDVDQAIRQCENGKELISNIKEVLVLEKKNVGSDEFYRYYELDNLAGKVLLAPEEFQTSFDKKKGHIPVIYSAPLSNVVYFSSYGKNGETGKDIYFVTRTGGGGWSDPVKLPAPINSEYNEDFPFFHSDGKTLYFCSDGHNSMGGYDIFRSVYNPSTGSYTTPENLDFAINTPDDDLFYIADSLNQIAYFASARSSKQNRLDVYKVKVDLVPSNMIIIKGNFISEIDPALKNARITIEDEQTKRQIAIIDTDAKGNYLVDFKYGGQYNFYVEAGNNGIIHSGRVEVPRLDYIAAFRQELIMLDDNGTERLMIKNYFDTPLVEDTEALISEVLKKRALLDVTPEDELAEKELEVNTSTTGEPFADLYLSAGFIKTNTNEGISEWADESVTNLKGVNEKYKSMAGVAFRESKVYDEKASQLILQADTKIRAYKYNKDTEKRIELLKDAVKLRVEAEENLLNASAALLLANSLSASVQKRAVLIAELEKSSRVINKAIEEQNSEAFKAEISNLNELDKDLKSNDRGIGKAVSYIESIKDVEVEDEKMQLAHAENLRKEKNSTLALINRLETQLNNAEEKEKSSIAIQLANAQSNLAVIEKDNELAWKKYREQDWEANVAIQGSIFANQWEGQQGESLPEQGNINRVIAHVNNQQSALSLIADTEDEALMALGVSVDEILTTESAVLSSTIVANEVVNQSKTESESIAMTKKQDENVMEEKSEDNVVAENQEEISVVENQKESKVVEKPEFNIESDLIAGYSDKLSAAQNNPIEIDRLQETLILKNQLLTQVNNELNSEETTYDRTTLNSLKSELTDEIKLMKISFEAALENQQSGFKDITYYIPEYQDKIDELDHSNLTNLEKNEAKKKFLEFALEQLKTLRDSISAIEIDDDDFFTIRLVREDENSLNANITNVKAEIFRIQQELEALSAAVMDLPSNPDLIDIAYPAYADKKTLIDNNASFSEEEKATRMIQLNESLMAKIDAQIADLNEQKKIAAFDSFPLLNAKIESYETIKEEKQIEISDAIDIIAINSKSAADESSDKGQQDKIDEPVVLSAEDKSTMMAELDPGFETTYALLMGSNKPESEKLTQAIRMHETMIVSVDQKIASLKQDEGMLSNNAETAQIAEELKNWEALSEDVKQENEKLVVQLSAIDIAVDTTQPETKIEQKDKGVTATEETTVLVVENPESWNALITSAKTDKAIEIWINRQEIAIDPGIKNNLIKTDIEEQSQRISEINQLKVKLAEIEAKLIDVDKKEAKKLEKEKEQVTTEIQEKETELFSERIPFLIDEVKIRLAENNIDATNKSAAKSYIQKTEAYLFQAKSAQGKEKLDILKQAYQLSLMALQKSGVTELALQLAHDAGMDSFYSIADESELSYEDKKQFYSQNIKILTKLEVDNQLVFNKMKEEGASEHEVAYKEQEATLKIYRDAIVWNRLKLDELNASQSEIEQSVISQKEDLMIPESDEGFASAMNEVGLDESQIAYIKSNPELQSYYELGWKEKVLEAKINALQLHKAEFIDNAEVSQKNANESEAVNLDELSGAEAIVAYENSKKYNTDAIVWYEKADSLDVIIDILETRKSEVKANRIAYHDKMEADNKASVAAIEAGTFLAVDEQKPEEKIIEEPIVEKEDVEVVTDKPVVAEIEAKSEGTLAETEVSDNKIEQPKEVADEIKPVKTEVPENKNTESVLVPVTGFIYESGTNFYSGEESIPVDPPLPTGVIFKVQIGAFRNPIPTEHFTGLTPLTAEKLENGITRYSVGIFYDMPTAQMARAQVRSVGYDDAFIVAFLNGKRIPINQALAMLNGGEQQQTANNTVVEDKTGSQTKSQKESGNTRQEADVAENEIAKDNTVQSTAGSQQRNADTRSGISQNSTGKTIDVDGTEETALPTGYYNKPNVAPATEVESTTKMFYTVQVGVYSKAVSLGDIYNIQPLNVERTGLGYTRYTSGQFSDIIEAEKHKEYVIEKGIADAFITAYYKGRRISVEKAQTLMLTEPDVVRNESTITQFSIDEPLVKADEDSAGLSRSLITKVTPMEREEIIRNARASDLRYVIYLGSYQDGIPNDVAVALLKYSDAGIKRAINQGILIYSTREMRSMYEAEEWLGRFQEAGVEEARIIYVVSGEEITLKQAKDILDK